jgi:uncharacterized protein (DUF1697 family)
VNPYVILLRGINVGGKNIIPMAELRNRLADDGFSDVTTYIASGNVVLRSDLPAAEVKTGSRNYWRRISTLMTDSSRCWC